MYRDVIEIFAENEKELKTLIQIIIYRQDIGREFGMEKWHADNENWETRNNRRNRSAKGIITFGERENCKYLKILEVDTIKKNRDENENKRRVLQKNLSKQGLPQKSRQRHKLE